MVLAVDAHMNKLVAINKLKNSENSARSTLPFICIVEIICNSFLDALV